MKKINKKNKLIVTLVIILIVIILAIIFITNIINNKNKVANKGYFATTANAGSDLIASYIQKGITIGGITGTLEVLDTSDATATPEDIAYGKTAYVNGKKIIGTYIGKNNMMISLETKEIENGFKLIATIKDTEKEVSGYTFFLNNKKYKEITTGEKSIEIDVTDQEFSTIECFADAKCTDGTFYCSNTLNVDNYIIRTANDFDKLRQEVEGGNTFEGKRIRVLNDIDLEGSEQNRNWVAIGNESHPFSGTFEGNNYKILNLFNTETDENNQGLFGYTDNAIIQNLVIESGNIKGVENVGAITGKSKNSNYYNCINKIYVEASEAFVGGIVGRLEGGEGEILQCINNGEIIGKGVTSTNSRNETFSGGIVGYTESAVKKCYNTGNITSQYSVVGGIAGASKADVEECYNTAIIKAEGANNDFNSEVGGISGTHQYGTMTNCYNKGEIYSTGNMSGGLVGLLVYEGKVDKCYNEGNVTSKAGTIGGLVGDIMDNCFIQNSYNIGKIVSEGNSNNETKDTYIGGIVGFSSGNIDKCWNKGEIESNSGTIGGISGVIVNANITQCYNTGIAKATGANIKGDGIQGGIVGYAENSQINYCYNIAAVQSNYNCIGGLIGIVNLNSIIKNSYNIGNVAGKQSVGPLIGLNLNQISLDESAINCYYLGDTTLNSSRTAADMKTVQFINLIGGQSIWKLDSQNINNGFVILNWQ